MIRIVHEEAVWSRVSSPASAGLHAEARCNIKYQNSVSGPGGQVDITLSPVENRATQGKRVGADDRLFLSDISVLGFKELKQDVTNTRAACFPTPTPCQPAHSLRRKR